jgi:6-phosphofructokinase 2
MFGAGDGWVEWIWALANPLKEVLLGGVCGSAATMNEGTQLFKLEDAKII